MIVWLVPYQLLEFASDKQAKIDLEALLSVCSGPQGS